MATANVTLRKRSASGTRHDGKEDAMPSIDDHKQNILKFLQENPYSQSSAVIRTAVSLNPAHIREFSAALDGLTRSGDIHMEPRQGRETLYRHNPQGPISRAAAARASAVNPPDYSDVDPNPQATAHFKARNAETSSARARRGQ